MTRHILMTADAVGGVWPYTMELCAALAPHDVEITLAIMGPVRPHQLAEARALPNVTVHARHFALEWMPDPWHDVERAGHWLLELAADASRPVDLVHLNGYSHGALPWPVPVVEVAHSCVLSWWTAVYGAPAPPGWERYRTAVRRGLDGASAVVAPSRAMLEALIRHHGFVARPTVIPNSRTATAFLPAAKQPFVFSAGRSSDPAKNIAAVDRLQDALPWPVYIAGDSQQAGLGWLDTRTLASWLSHASIVALPARYEPFGLTALEAALAGAALVLGDIPSQREIWGDAAVYVAPDDDRALARTVLDLINWPGRREALATDARRRALRFTPQRHAQAMMRVYEGAIIASSGKKKNEALRCAS